MTKNKEIEFIEFIVPENKNMTYELWQLHINRYYFASKFCKNKIILDVACGSGYGSYYLSQSALRVVGGDISKDALEYPKKNYRSRNLQFLQLDAHNLPFKDETFDVIVSFETIEHLENYYKFLYECKRVLKNGGLIICSTPNREVFGNINPHHVHEFTPDEFQTTLQEVFGNVVLYQQSYGFMSKYIKKAHIILSKIKNKNIIFDKLFNMLRKYTTMKIVTSDSINNISSIDEIIDKKYRVRPYQKTIYDQPLYIIGISQKKKKKN